MTYTFLSKNCKGLAAQTVLKLLLMQVLEELPKGLLTEENLIKAF